MHSCSDIDGVPTGGHPFIHYLSNYQEPYATDQLLNETMLQGRMMRNGIIFFIL